MFPLIPDIHAIRPAVAHKSEIRWTTHPNDVTIGCYLFSDSTTFDSPLTLECRGIAFDRYGAIVSRPLHKFFNLGERPTLTPDALRTRTDIAAIYDKLDGSMIATAWVDHRLRWRSKKGFHTDVVQLTEALLQAPAYTSLLPFATELAANGLTAIFELTHPAARIVVAHAEPALRLLHVRDNLTGQYVLLDDAHPVHLLIRRHHIPVVAQHLSLTIDALLHRLPDMTHHEGYVVQFDNGDMVKLKCPWYIRLHRSLTFLRERDIATLALHENLDDLKQALRELGLPLDDVLAIEARLAAHLRTITETVEQLYEAGRTLDRKSYALQYRSHPLFSLLMQRYTGQPLALLAYYLKHHLKQDFSLRPLVSAALTDAIEG